MRLALWLYSIAGVVTLGTMFYFWQFRVVTTGSFITCFNGLNRRVFHWTDVVRFEEEQGPRYRNFLVYSRRGEVMKIPFAIAGYARLMDIVAERAGSNVSSPAHADF